MNSIFRNRSYINILLLLRIIGWLLLTEGAMMVIPAVCALICGEREIWQLLISIGITSACGFGLMSLRPHTREMGKREAILLTGLTWVILSIFGMIPFLITGTHMSVTDAFFETMSGFTTTGASVLNTLDGVPHSILLWRCVVQWVGGLGIILFTLAIVPMLNYQGGMQLFNAEVTGITHDKLRPRVSYTAKGLWGVYLILTVLLIILLNFSEMDFFDSVCYGLSTMSTGGFATSDMTITELDNDYVKTLITIFMFLGGVNFALIYKALHGKIRDARKNDALKVYLWTILICFIILAANKAANGLVNNVSDLTLDPLFQAVSILSSTGLTEPDFHDWGPIAVVVLVIMMIMGACAGSTSGGAKIDRFIVLFKFLQNEFYRLMHPNTIRTVCVNGKGTPTAIVMKTLAFLFLYIIVIILGGVALSLLGLPLRDSLFCSLSAISNTGLGTDITGLAGNYAYVPDTAKWILSFIMLVGRLELFTVLVIFTPSFWKK
ncbi:MAG: TrkH family potassium uptake protein [Clostridium sp.]|nr:TrkH family potassium uptake protein [Prevotella sp.]MCM1428740.1 TrkH family potassium uptake protein [Clostridium sp.]MCM1475115.1 TrkH family potassium uptake protein [Muribaculaceae bacterium]